MIHEKLKKRQTTNGNKEQQAIEIKNNKYENTEENEWAKAARTNEKYEQ